MSSLKRKLNEGEKQPCRYGAKCFRRNPYHLQEFSHPEDVTVKQEEPKASEVRKGCCHYELTTVAGIDDTYNRPPFAVGIQEILKEDSDKFVQSVQFNYCFDVGWLLKMYPASCREKPLTLVHGHTGKDKTDLEATAMELSNMDLIQARLPIPYGTHHTKMMLLFYTHGMRVIIATANLIEQDWHQKTQGVWRSPLFVETADNYTESEDSFKRQLIEYLSAYKSDKMNKFIAKIKEFDMSSARVHLVASIPGRHTGTNLPKWGHLKLRKLLRTHGASREHATKSWPVIGQFSSIGSLGPDSGKWLCGEWLESLSAVMADDRPAEKAPLSLIYPTMENVRNSLEGYSAGGSLPYGVQLAMKQRYLKEHLNGWVADGVGRSLASPHIKSYTRISPHCNAAAWFLLTSANLSKAAWGVYEKDKTQMMIRSYEIGVLFFPQEVKVGKMFQLDDEDDTTKEHLRLPFDVPLTPYSSTDKPWVWDIRYTKEDSHGRLWVPQ